MTPPAPDQGGFGPAREQWTNGGLAANAPAASAGPVSNIVVNPDGSALHGFDIRLNTIELKLDGALRAHEEEKKTAGDKARESATWFRWGFGLAFPAIIALALAMGGLFFTVRSMNENGTEVGKQRSQEFESRIVHVEMDVRDLKRDGKR